MKVKRFQKGGRCIGRQAARTKSPNTFLIRKSLIRLGLRTEKLLRLTLTSHLAAVLEFVREKNMLDSNFCVPSITLSQNTSGN
ncbi:hypothetical protein ACFX13_020974 [Malus domestica]